jgi:solute carrier family 25 phosphate transporter 23/24/25/41
MESESQKSLDSRVERLWQILDTRKEGELDLNALKKGLKKLDHRKHKPSSLGHDRPIIALF